MDNLQETLGALRTQLSKFLGTVDFTIERIPGGASSRVYYQLGFEDQLYFPSPQIALMVVPGPDLRMLEDYMNVDYYFKRMGILTPRLFEVQMYQGWGFQEFVAAPTLEMYLHQNPQQLGTVIPEAIDFLIALQEKAIWEDHCPAFQRRFDVAKYEFEFEFHFREQLLGFYFRQKPDAALMTDFKTLLCTTLDINVPILVHRDFQSSNMFYDQSAAPGQRFKLIDFQDSRYGTPVYDLVSLLWDSYLPVPADLRAAQVQRFFATLATRGIEWTKDYYDRIVDYTVIQRKLHDAGAFAYNYRRFGSKKYLPYIRQAISLSIDRMQSYKELQPMATYLQNLLEKPY